MGAEFKAEDEAGRAAPWPRDTALATHLSGGGDGRAFDPAAQRPGGSLAVEHVGEVLRLRSKRGGGFQSLRVWAATLAFCVALATGGCILEALRLPVTVWVVLAFGCSALAAIAVYAIPAFCREELLVSCDEVRKYWRHPWGRFGESALQCTDIRSVELDSAQTGDEYAPTVTIRGAGNTIRFGHAVTVQEQLWVRDLIAEVVAKVRDASGLTAEQAQSRGL